jgi:hypothetical protein
MTANTYRQVRTEVGAVSDQIFLLTFDTAAAQPWFTDWYAGRACVREMRVLHRFGLATSLAWVLLPRALHWLVMIRSDPLDALVRRFKSRSALMINKALGRGGQVWEPGFARRAVAAHEDLWSISRVILATPIDSGLVATIGEYSLWDAWWIGAEQVVATNPAAPDRGAEAAAVSVRPDAAVKEVLRPIEVSCATDGTLVRRAR